MARLHTRPPVIGLVALSLLALQARAETPAPTVTVVFEPPQIEIASICAPSLPDEQLAAEWQGWDGKALPDREPELIRRDLTRLTDLDAIRWFETIEKAYALMPGVDAKFTPDKALLAKVELLIAAGKLKELTNQRLVEALMQSDAGGSPRLQNILADFLMQGTGIAPDKERGLALLVAAGYGGNADALLKIVALREKGTEIPGWDVPQDIAVTMAFGGLVGKLDPLICDRVARIAREYMNGTIVTRDVGLAEKWFRFAADMGDGASAWKVAEMHLRSEDIVKSNEVLIKYLTKAADAGLPYAEVALGRLYEQGALVPMDAERARKLYARAAAYGDRAGLLRNALFLQSRAKADPAYRADFRNALQDFAARPDAPGWVYITLGDLILDEKGRWAGEAEAVALYEKAAAQGDVDASKRLTPIRFRYATTPQSFYTVIDEVVDSVSNGGEIDPMNGLKNAFTCRAPAAPQRDEALYWDNVSAATGTKTVDFSPEELLALVAHPEPLAIARLQSQALYGRPTALAQYMEYLDRSGAAPSELAFWDDYAARFERVTATRGRLERRFQDIGMNRGDPVALLRAAIAEGDLGAGADLAAILMQQDPGKNAAEALAMLEPVAATGNGAALRMLPQVAPKAFPDLAAVYAAYADVIDARGDFDALVLALPFQNDPARLADYERRAVTATDCTFAEVITLADAMGKTGSKTGFAKWMEVADFLSEDDDWRLVELGDLLRQYSGEEGLGAQMAYYQRGYEGGNTTAIHRLLDIVGRAGTPRYDPARASDLYVALVERSDPDDIPRALARLSTAEPLIQDSALARLDLPALYRTAAESGNRAGMREYGKLLMASAGDEAGLAEGADWIAKSADKGDVGAMLTYADMLAFGLGVAPSRPDALLWLQKAADAGNADAAAKVRSMTLAIEVSQ